MYPLTLSSSSGYCFGTIFRKNSSLFFGVHFQSLKFLEKRYWVRPQKKPKFNKLGLAKILAEPYSCPKSYTCRTTNAKRHVYTCLDRNWKLYGRYDSLTLEPHQTHIWSI